MKLSGAQLVIKLLENFGIEKIAGIPGGAALPLYDALVDSSIQHILARHEQGAGFIAQGMARVSGKPAVCLASSGPGATNLVTAVADAHMDSIPLIAITAQVPQALIGTDAFQETDTFGLMLPITKHNYLVRSTEELLTIVPEAFYIASSGRPGPVSIDIPKNILQNSIEIEQFPEIKISDAVVYPKTSDLEQMRALIEKAKKPLLMIGGGAIHSESYREIRQLAEQESIPVVSSFMGLGIFPSDHELYLGMLGMHGARYTNLILEECDLLIGAGVRFDDRATGKVNAFCPDAKIIHIDIDNSQLSKIKKPTLAIHADLGETLRLYLKKTTLKPTSSTQRNSWLERINFLKKRFPLRGHNAANIRDKIFTPYGLLKTLAATCDENICITTDVGQHQMWTAQAFPFKRPRQWLSSGGLGTMGFGLPAAIGASLEQPNVPVICISGDGSLLMNIQELNTVAEHKLNIKIIIMNNQNLGLVRQQQSLFYQGRYQAINNTTQINFAALAEAMGIPGLDLKISFDPYNDLQNAMQSEGPYLIDIPIQADEKVFPMVPPGASNSEMIEASSP